MNKALDVKITDMEEHCTSGVLKHRQMGCREPDHELKETDILAAFRLTPQGDVDPEEAAAAGEGSTWTDRLTDSDYYRTKAYRVEFDNLDNNEGFKLTRMSFMIQRPDVEPGFKPVRQEGVGRQVKYTLRSHATSAPPEARCNQAPR